MEIAHYTTTAEIAEVCSFLHARHYYVSGFLGQKILKSPTSIRELVIAGQDGIIRGWCLICEKSCLLDMDELIPTLQIACYVDPSYRRRGIGTAMVRAINPDADVEHGFGLPESIPFWNAVR